MFSRTFEGCCSTAVNQIDRDPDVQFAGRSFGDAGPGTSVHGFLERNGPGQYGRGDTRCKDRCHLKPRQTFTAKPVSGPDGSFRSFVDSCWSLRYSRHQRWICGLQAERESY